MAKHKFLTPRLGASFIITKMGLAASSPVGWALMLILTPLLNFLANMGLAFANTVVIEWTSERDKKEFDALQSEGLNVDYVASLSPKQREEKSNAFKAVFRKFAMFGFIKRK